MSGFTDGEWDPYGNSGVDWKQRAALSLMNGSGNPMGQIIGALTARNLANRQNLTQQNNIASAAPISATLGNGSNITTHLPTVPVDAGGSYLSRLFNLGGGA